MPVEYYEHLLIFGGVCVATWLLFIYFWPRMLLYVYKRALLVKGFGDGPVPINTLYAVKTRGGLRWNFARTNPRTDRRLLLLATGSEESPHQIHTRPRCQPCRRA